MHVCNKKVDTKKIIIHRIKFFFIIEDKEGANANGLRFVAAKKYLQTKIGKANSFLYLLFRSYGLSTSKTNL
jgi:hypothetical protein